MAYEFFMDGVLLPVTPSKLQLKIGNANKTYTLINDGEINVLKSPKLTDISFDVLLPSVKYAFTTYENNIFQSPVNFLDLFERLKTTKEPFQFIVNRTYPNGTMFFDTNMKVSLEDYNIKEDAKDGFDIVVSISLKQYRDYSTKKYKVKKKKLKKKKNRSSKKVKLPTTYTTKKGDTLWKLAKRFYGDGSKYKIIQNKNKKKIQNANKIGRGQKLTIPKA